MYSRSQIRALSILLLFTQDWSSVDSLQWDIESTLELDSKEANTPMGPSGPHFELIYLVDMDYKGQISFRFTFVHKGILVIT